MYPDPFHRERAPNLSTVDALIEELERQAALLTTVATGGADFRDKPLQREYKERRRRLVEALEERGLAYPFPWQDLPQWHGYWTGKNLGTWHQRRVAIQERVDPILDLLEQQGSGLRVTDPGSGSLTWDDLDARVDELIDELAGAISRDDLQDVGRRSREILIDCASCSPTHPWCRPARLRRRPRTRRRGSISSSPSTHPGAIGTCCASSSAPPGSSRKR